MSGQTKVESAATNGVWPELPLEAWNETYETLHRWIQIVGKVRLRQSPWLNHYWHSALYVTSTGLTTSALVAGERLFQIDFDFVQHRLEVHTDDGRRGGFALEAQPVAAFYARVLDTLARLDLPSRIHPRPNEVADNTPFPEDETHHTYDPDYARRFWQATAQADRVFRRFRSHFIGKCSPVHFFWGAPDLAVTRFSGRTAPRHPGGVPNLPDRVAIESYSHEVCSAGFWPGSPGISPAAFYSYAYPEPAGYAERRIQPEGAYYHEQMKEFLLPYDVVRTSRSPDDTLLTFLQSSYEAAADLGQWDRTALERVPQTS